MPTHRVSSDVKDGEMFVCGVVCFYNIRALSFVFKRGKKSHTQIAEKMKIKLIL